MKSKKQTKEVGESFFDSIFPETNILFGSLLSMFVTYYTLILLIKIIQKTQDIILQTILAIAILWVVISWVVFNLRPLIIPGSRKI